MKSKLLYNQFEVNVKKRALIAKYIIYLCNSNSKIIQVCDQHIDVSIIIV